MAQRRPAEESFEQPSLSLTGTEAGAALQKLAVEKLAAHRLRRLTLQPQMAAGIEAAAPDPDSAAARVRAAVAERYRQSQSYREFLESTQTLGPDVAVGGEFATVAETKPVPVVLSAEAAPGVMPTAVAAPPAAVEVSTPEFRVRMYEAMPATVSSPVAADGPVMDATAQNELAELEEEIEFRFAPEFADHHIEALPLQANIIEFPRQIVAPRKARPRLAEGPLQGALGESSAAGQAPPQLRIFEVEPDFIATEPTLAAVAEELAPPSWQRNDSADAATVARQAELKVAAQESPLLKSVATMELRLMAACVDGFWVGLGFVAWAMMTGYFGGATLLRMPRWELGAGAVAAYAVLAFIYALACFTFSDATPGMTYAEIGLCTFEDENPTRAAMRKRLLATVAAAAPLGLGLLWAAMDSERLAWNDRLSRTYLRSY